MASQNEASGRPGKQPGFPCKTLALAPLMNAPEAISSPQSWASRQGGSRDRSTRQRGWVWIVALALERGFSFPIGEVGLIVPSPGSTSLGAYLAYRNETGSYTPREVRGRGGRPSELGKQLWQFNRSGKVRSGKLTAAQGGSGDPLSQSI